jgi:hypothetical protein
MKKIDVKFRIDVNCTISFKVPDDYQIPSTDQTRFWNDLKEKAGDQIVVDPTMTDGACWYFSDDSFFLIDQVESVIFEKVVMLREDGEIKETVFNCMPRYHR